MGKMYFPGEKPEVIDEMMDKESWIQSRTDNPDRLGRDIWEKKYDYLKARDEGTELPKEEIPLEIQKKMVGEYLAKNGLSCDLNNDAQWSIALSFFQMNGKGQYQYPTEELQKTLDMFDSKDKKKASTLRDTLKKCQQNNVQAVQAARNKAKAGRG